MRDQALCCGKSDMLAGQKGCLCHRMVQTIGQEDVDQVDIGVLNRLLHGLKGHCFRRAITGLGRGLCVFLDEGHTAGVTARSPHEVWQAIVWTLLIQPDATNTATLTLEISHPQD